MRLRKRQSWTITWAAPDPDNPHGRVRVYNSDTGEVREVLQGDTVNVDASLELTQLELGWELAP